MSVPYFCRNRKNKMIKDFEITDLNQVFDFTEYLYDGDDLVLLED